MTDTVAGAPHSREGLPSRLKRLSLALLPSLAAGCFETSTGPVPFDTREYAFDFPVGRTRLLDRAFTIESGGTTRTTHVLGWFKIEKDTTYSGFPAQIVESRYWEPYPDTVIRYRVRELYVREESQVSVYAFPGGEYPGYLEGLIKAGPADSEGLSDGLIALRYPLAEGSRWPVRPYMDTNKTHGMLQKTFIRLDTLPFKGKPYECGVLGIQLFEDGGFLYSWVSRIGLMKAEVDYGLFQTRDSADAVTGWGYSRESYTLLDLDIDSSAVPGYFERFGNTHRDAANPLRRRGP